ncbi:MAG: preprotein translocase subunit SecG [Firmicutes bacterium RBG_13_65_8]|nr:MAG: preprotein translocase subunit SecG [Firmicutes bacterium RBG_13_65_8]
MVIALTVIHVLFTLALIVGVLMQSSKSAGLSGAISGGAEQLFGKHKGLDDILSRWTTVFAVGFLLSALVLTVLRS